jgi:hypothetical protein
VGGILWFAPHAAHTSVYVPFSAGACALASRGLANAKAVNGVNGTGTGSCVPAGYSDNAVQCTIMRPGRARAHHRTTDH